MKGKRLWVAFLAIMMLVSSLTACGNNKEENKPKPNTEAESQKDTQQDTENTEQGETPSKVVLTDKALAGDTLIDFTKGANSAVVFESDGWTNGDVFNVVWTKNNVKYAAGKMALSITKENKNAWVGDKEVTFPYTAGEARTQNYYGFGDYEVKMKPSANEGTASTFFICTGNYDEKYVLDANGNVVSNPDGTIQTVKNPHDEIDIEFLGKDTTKVQFNFFVNGKGGNEFMYDLGFDASKEYHEYGFRWEKNSITWFVDDKPVYKVTTDKTAKAGENVKIVEAIPATPGRILMNYWCGNEDAVGWMGEYKGNVKDNGCEYQWIHSTAKGAPLNPDVKQPGSDAIDFSAIKWDSIAAINPTFASTEKYTVTTTGTSSNVKYTNVGGSTYINVEMDIANASKQKNVIHLTLKNNGTKDANVRVNIVDQQLLDKGAKNSSTNRSAVLDGVEVKTDLEWGGSFFDIKAGQTGEAVIYYIGEVEKLQLMIDSARNDAGNYSGDITISNIKFEKQGDIVDENTVGKYKIEPFETMKIMKSTNILNVRDLPHVSGNKIGYLQNGDIVKVTGKCKETGWYRIVIGDKVGYVSAQFMVDEPNGVPKPSDANSIYINRVEYTFNPNEYILQSGADNSLNVKYKDLPGESYKNFSTKIEGLSKDFNKLTLKVKNNGNKKVEIRVDIVSKTQINANHKACNVYSTQDGTATNTDKEWGGSFFGIEAGETATLEIVFDANKTVDELQIFVDSHIYQDPVDAHSGDITILSAAFGKGTAPVQPEEPDNGEEGGETGGEEGGQDTPSTTGTKLNVNWVNESLTASATSGEVDSITLEYAGAKSNYGACASFAPVGDITGKDTFSVKITNNGSTAAKVRFDLIGTDGSTRSHISATAEGAWYQELQQDGYFVVVGNGTSVTVVITYNPSNAPADIRILPALNDDTDEITANVTLSEFEFSKVESNDKLNVNWVNEAITASATSGEVDSITLEYAGAKSNYGACASFAPVESIAGKNTFSVKVTNNGSTAAKVRFDLIGADGSTRSHVSATAEGAWYQELQQDGYFVVVGNGTSVTVVITYNPSNAPADIRILPALNDDTDEITADVTLSDFKFSAAE